MNEILPQNQIQIINSLNHLQKKVYDNAKAKGFWPITTMHSTLHEAFKHLKEEVQEAEDAVFNWGSEDAPSELADIVLIVLSIAGELKVDLAKAIIEKHHYNLTRADHEDISSV
jgi:NTP pyrophosphatase (non-canonical NTP hydrolase)